MKYFVKNEDGELTFQSIHELRAMFQQGLVSPDDQVRPEDSPNWRTAAAIPELREFAASRASGGHFWLAVVTLICLSLALSILLGHNSFSMIKRVAFVAILMLPVLGMSQRAFTKAIKRER